MGIDIGGTFTDIVVIEKKTGKIVKLEKVSTNPKEPHKTVLSVVKQIEKKIRENIELLIHATTIATNVLLGQLGLELPRCALITTRGFRDVIEIGRQRRPRLYDLYFKKPKPLISRKYRMEIDERVNSSGEIIKKPSWQDIDEIAKKIIKERIVSVAICLINSYINPNNEIVIKNRLKQLIPELMISTSTEIDNQYKEFERTSTTVVNAVLMPIVSEYLTKLNKSVKGLCPRAKLLIMKSDGGVSTADVISKKPVSIIESGPAAGVIATLFLGKILGKQNLISFDMGGTTAKSGTVVDGEPVITTEYEVGGEIHAGRIVKGSGYPVRYPFIDLAEVSSGGGSIIWVDQAGALKVGPISAGADPGPACYGKGGTDPTITDANLILGRIGEQTLLGGNMKIYTHMAINAMRNKVSEKIGLEIEEAAVGAIKIANNIMSKVIRIVTIERGLDPRDFVLVAFGGAGPMHICPIAEELSIQEVIVPIAPGLFSAIGLLATDIKHTYIKPVMRATDELCIEDVREIFKSMIDVAIEHLSSMGFRDDRIKFRCILDMRYIGQGYELLLDVPLIETISIRDIEDRFHRLHESVYGYSIAGEGIEIINARLEAFGLMDEICLERIKRRNRINPKDAIKERRLCFFESIDDFVNTPIYDKSRLYAGDKIEGPAIVEYYDATVVIYPSWNAEVDDYGNIIMRIERHDRHNNG